MNFASWNDGLLQSALLIVVAGMWLVSSSSFRERILALAALIQAIGLMFTVNAAYYSYGELQLFAIAMLSVLGLWWLQTGFIRDQNEDVDRSIEPLLPKPLVADAVEPTGTSFDDVVDE